MSCDLLARLFPELVNQIIEYLDTHTRLRILRQKYPEKYMKEILKNMPRTDSNMRKIIVCVTAVNPNSLLTMNKLLENQRELEERRINFEKEKVFYNRRLHLYSKSGIRDWEKASKISLQRYDRYDSVITELGSYFKSLKKMYNGSDEDIAKEEEKAMKVYKHLLL
jgi:hypothetical protein